MWISIILTVGVRLALSALFGIVFSMGAMGIAWGMGIDLTIRAVLFIQRLKSGKWETFRLI